ncbi:uncharacterized protein V1510DRAFT_417105 [Dipodascopsis tothii]|uniref:uncharacterized protein n=1 Tax=Dipodascopsis tothii TaxID=44089 RepID=UPI0034CE9F2B
MENGYTSDSEEELVIDYSDLEQKYAVSAEEGLDTFIVIDGAPVVTEKKVEALTKILKKLFGEVGRIREDGGFYMPMEDGKSKGYIFVEYETPEQAAAAVRTFNNRRLDQKHTLLVNKFTDVQRYAMTSSEADTFEAPEEVPYVEQEHLRSWLKEPSSRDQFILYRGEDVGVYWNRKLENPDVIVNRPKWTETYVTWSPLGTFMCSVHRQGVQLWGGESFSRKVRFAHPGIQLIDFSPNENYMVTWSPEPIMLPPEDSPARASVPFTSADEGKQIVVWNVKTGLPMRTFSSALPDPDPTIPKKINWPAFKWSSDDKYLARVIPGQQIFIYETPGMGLLDKKSIKIDGVVDFEFSPAKLSTGKKKNGNDEHMLSFWTPEVNNQSARVTVMKVPSKEIVRTRNLFNVADCRMHWQSEGDFLCVKVVRYTKTKKSTFTNLEFFRMREKNIPIELVELKETVVNFAWEPKGDRLVIISTGDLTPVATGPAGAGAGRAGAAVLAPAPQSTGETTVSFYGLERSKGVNGLFRQIRTLEKKNSNSLFWSPGGRFVVVASVGTSTSTNGSLEFWDFDFEGERKEGFSVEDVPANLQLMATGNHYQLTDVEWDPTGRYVATSSSIWGRASETGYRIWDLKGALLREDSMDRFKQFLWRPRPPSLLTEEQKRHTRKNLRDFAKKFEQEDMLEETMANRELVEHLLRLFDEWYAWRETVEEGLAEEKAALGIDDSVKKEEREEIIEELVEEVIFEKEEELED